MRSLQLLLLVLMLALSSSAFADAETGQWYLTGMASYIDDDEDRGVDDGFAGGQIGVGRAINDVLNLEAFLARAALDGPNEQDQLSGGVDLQLLFGRENKWTPYLFAGAGYMEVNPLTAATEQGVLFSGGAGLLADIFGSSPVAARLEYRYRIDEAFADSLGDHIVSIGLQIPLGSQRPMPAPAPQPEPEGDGDNDGVPDSRDRCPNTPAGVEVDRTGCALDSDGDRVPDYRDECPNTRAGVTVNAQGCEPDGDGDGVVDRLDRCPNTREGAQVDVNGCEIREEIQLPGVNFETNSDRLLAGTTGVLDSAAATLERNPTITVEVAGHTDSDGAAEYNESLSQRRAETVRDYLISKGVAANRMTARGYGEREPIADNSTAAGKAQNRRVVLRIIDR